MGLLVPVWRASDCSLWHRVRYTYVSLIFGLVVGVFAYWNLLGWHY